MNDELIGVARAAQEHPGRVALDDDFGSRLTYAELDRRVNQTIHAFEQLGIGPGSHLAILAENRADTILVHQAAYRGGLYFTPLNPRLRANEINYVLADSNSSVLVADVVHRDLAERAATQVGVPIIELGGTADNDLATISASEPEDPVPYQFGSVVSYTSGTTGVPKGVVRDRIRPLPAQLEAMLTFGLRMGMNADHDRYLATAPLYHGGPLISAFHTMNLGGSVYVMRHFDAERTLQLIESLAITSSYMVPTMYHRLLQLPEDIRHRYDLSSLQSVMHTGAPCSIEIKEAMLDWLGPVVYECYAATEGYGTYTVCTPDDARSHPGTVGRPPDDLIVIRDELGNDLPVGEPGLIYAATLPGFAAFEYKGDVDQTSRAYGADGRYTVGDMGYFDEDGYLFLTGRATDMIISGGVNIYPAEAEGALLQHPAVADVGILGIPDAEWGERVVAIVEPAHPVDDPEVLGAELIAFCRERLASYKCPRLVLFVDDLGRDPSGKLRKNRLREQVQSMVGGPM